MTWADLFARADEYGATVADVRAALADRRERDGDAAETDDSGEGEST